MSPETIIKLSFPQLDTPHTSLHVLFEYFLLGAGGGDCFCTRTC